MTKCSANTHTQLLTEILRWCSQIPRAQKLSSYRPGLGGRTQIRLLLNAPTSFENDAHLAELHEPRDTSCPAVETVKRVLPFRGDLVTQSLGGRHGLTFTH